MSLSDKIEDTSEWTEHSTPNPFVLAEDVREAVRELKKEIEGNLLLGCGGYGAPVRRKAVKELIALIDSKFGEKLI